jgi:hypothetical protein
MVNDPAQKNPPEYSEQLLREFESQAYFSFLTTPKPLMPRQLKRKKDEPEVYKYKGYVLGHYRVDMDTIVLGNTTSFEFTLKNVTQCPFSMKFVEEPIQNTGFAFEPKVIDSLAPGEVATCKSTFMSTEKRNDLIGDVLYQVPILFSHNFGVVLHLAARLEVPVLTLSQPSLNFSTVIIGQYVTMVVQLQNLNPVSLEYEIKPPQSTAGIPLDSGIARTLKFTPSSGCLPSQTAQNIEFTFLPAA